MNKVKIIAFIAILLIISTVSGAMIMVPGPRGEAGESGNVSIFYTGNMTANMTAGPQGIQGIQGPQGEIGLPNMTAGPMGLTGATGPIGPIGPMGMMNQTPNMTAGIGIMNQTPNMTLMLPTVYYLHGETNNLDPPYYLFDKNYPTHSEKTLTATLETPGVEYLIGQFSTGSGDPNLQVLVPGDRRWYTYASVDSASTGDTRIVYKLSVIHLNGTESLIYSFDGQIISYTSVGLVLDQYTMSTPYLMNSTDRFIIRYYGKTTSSADRTITMYFDDSSHVSKIETPILLQGLKGDTGATGATGATGGTGGQILYFRNAHSTDPVTYEGLIPVPAGATEVNEAVTVKNTLGEVYIDSYITDIGYPALTQLPAGLWRFRTYHYVDSSSGTTTMTFKIYNRTSSGAETLLFTATSGDINDLTTNEYLTSYVQTSAYNIALTDRIVVKTYGQTTHSSNVILHWVYEGSTHTSHIQTTLDTAPATSLSFNVIAGESIKKGQAVYISGSSGGNPQVLLADNTNTAKSRVVGLMTTDTASGSMGSVRRSGALTVIDTRTTNTYINPVGETWLAGDLLFATTGGGLTKVRPTSGRSVKAAYTMLGSNANDVLLAYPMENPVWTTAASGEGIVLRLGDNLGATKVSIRGYDNSEVAAIYSNGSINFGGLSGSKTYYVSDTSGGTPTRKLTFYNGILISES